MDDFNNCKNIFKINHYSLIFYLYCGIEHIIEFLDKDNKSNNINNFLDYNEILNLLYLYMNKENCQINLNNINIKDNSCIICSKLNKFKKNVGNNINQINELNKYNKGKSCLYISEKKVYDYNHKNLKNKIKIKKNISNFINSDISLKILKSNKSTKNNNNISNQSITNNSHDKRLLNYLKTTIDEKIKINNLNSHRNFESGNKNKIYTELKNYISCKNNNKNNNKSANKIYNYSYKNNILNININKDSNKENNSLQNFYDGKNKNFSNQKKKNGSNININNNHHIFLYPKVEQYLNNIYIINDNKNINSKIFKEEKNNIIKIPKENNESKIVKENYNITILNNMEIINNQINSMENIFEDFKKQTLEIKQQLMKLGEK